MIQSVPFFDYKALFLNHESALISIFRDVAGRGAFIAQRELHQFEQRIAEYTGAQYSIGVANATDGLQMLLMLEDFQPGDEVIFPSHTMVATASAIHFAGATPIPVEVGANHLIDVESVRQAITGKTKAIVVTQLNGRVADMGALQQLAQEHGLKIVEDAAQALGAKFNGQCAGTFDRGGCISFYPAKILGALGDAGIVLCNDEAQYQRLMLMRDHGRNPETQEVELWGFNSRLDNIQAAFLNYYFDQYEATVARRREIAALYQAELQDIEAIQLPPAPGADPLHFDVYQNYEIEATNRDQLKAWLAERGVGTLIQWGGKAVHQFTKLGFQQTLPKTDALFDRLLMLPINLFVSDEDIRYVCECVRKFYL